MCCCLQITKTMFHLRIIFMCRCAQSSYQLFQSIHDIRSDEHQPHQTTNYSTKESVRLWINMITAVKRSLETVCSRCRCSFGFRQTIVLKLLFDILHNVRYELDHISLANQMSSEKVNFSSIGIEITCRFDENFSLS